MSYKTTRTLSQSIRWLLCFFTIEATPIFANSLIAYGIDQTISIYSILWLISYMIVGRVFGYKRGDDPALGSILYFIVHVILALITWGVLTILTAAKIIPV